MKHRSSSVILVSACLSIFPVVGQRAWANLPNSTPTADMGRNIVDLNISAWSWTYSCNYYRWDRQGANCAYYGGWEFENGIPLLAVTGEETFAGKQFDMQTGRATQLCHFAGYGPAYSSTLAWGDDTDALFIYNGQLAQGHFSSKVVFGDGKTLLWTNYPMAVYTSIKCLDMPAQPAPISSPVPAPSPQSGSLPSGQPGPGPI